MDKQYVTHIVLQPCYTSARYNEQETVAASHLGLGAIRHFHAMGLIQGEKIGGQLLYSEEEIMQLRQIRRLQHDLGINLAGVEVILHLLKHLEAIHQELENKHALNRDGAP
jgi:MerR family transcriptional regulator/heat shock protein HspR